MAKTIEDKVVPARGSWSRVMRKGEHLRIVDLEGKQAVDFLCYNAHDYADRYAAGTVHYSVGLTPLFTIVEDTCGKHDTIGGCCSAALNTFRYKVGYQPNCRDNFLRELAMQVPVGQNGEMDMGPGISKAGDYVVLRAEHDVLAVISNCPQINNPVNDYNPTPIRVVVTEPAGGS